VTTALDEVVVTVAPERLVELCRTLRSDPGLAFDYLRCLSVVDYKESFQVVYHLWSMERRHKLAVKTNVDAKDPAVPSVVEVWPAADWFEREGHDLFGVVFQGHPNLKPLLLYEGFPGYPGRKSYPFHQYTEW
jgi:NADH-quinone oxidoreductase subunit C